MTPANSKLREGLNRALLRHTIFITKGRLKKKQKEKTTSSLCLSRLISDWRLNTKGKREKKKTVGNYCNTICSYGSGGTKTLGSAPRLEPKGKINTSAYRIGAFMAFKKNKKRRSGRDRWFGGRWKIMGGSGASSTLTGTRLSAPVNGGPRYVHQTSPPGRLLAPGGVCPDPEPTCNIAFNTFYNTRY